MKILVVVFVSLLIISEYGPLGLFCIALGGYTLYVLLRSDYTIKGNSHEHILVTTQTLVDGIYP